MDESFECSLCLERLDTPAPAPAQDNNANQQQPTNMPGARNSKPRKQATKKTPEPDLSEVVTTKCGHIFHKACVMEWFKQKNSGRQCPICRKEVPKRNGLLRIYPNGSSGTHDLASASEDDVSDSDNDNDTKEYQDLLRKYNAIKAREVIQDVQIKTLKEAKEKLKREVEKLEGSGSQNTSDETSGDDNSAKRPRTDDGDACTIM